MNTFANVMYVMSCSLILTVLYTISVALDGLTGGWVPAVIDANQWIQVYMPVRHIFTQVNAAFCV